MAVLLLMAAVAQLVEPSVVVRVVAGSSPVGRPSITTIISSEPVPAHVDKAAEQCAGVAMQEQDLAMPNRRFANHRGFAIVRPCPIPIT